jgi:ubiquinone/menaquinone biosynthesis C-methylase UbiE/predicted transcriptional regulator
VAYDASNNVETETEAEDLTYKGEMTSMTAQSKQPSPELFFEAVTAYQRSAAIKSAVELEIFTTIGEGKTSASEIAQRCNVSERGARILCDYLTLNGFLTKQDGRYGLTQDSALFLNKRSPAYVGTVVEFLAMPILTKNFDRLTEAIREGGNTDPAGGTVAPENPIWVQFARAMAPLMRPAAEFMANLADPAANQPLKILDIAAGHGVFGVAFAKRNPKAEVYAVDWETVLEVATENAKAAGVGDRHHKIRGDAFKEDFGGGYDIALLTNFLHHFDPPTNEVLLKKVRAALKQGGRALTLEFIPNDDRISPPNAAAFSLSMLAGTAGGDAYTYKELEEMLRNAGFSSSEMHEIPPMQRMIVSTN